MICEEICRPRDTRHAAEIITGLSKRIENELNHKGCSLSRNRIRTVIEEAVLNAWIHGNKQDFNKSVTVRWGLGDTFDIEVIDEGEGFDYTCPPDPTTSENITKDQGRGIFIIKYYADQVWWKAGGKHLVVSFCTDGNA